VPSPTKSTVALRAASNTGQMILGQADRWRAPELCNKKAQSVQGSNFGAFFFMAARWGIVTDDDR
jgi:hypothetical protein